jgi:ubiquinone biosynthesis protein COQ9
LSFEEENDFYPLSENPTEIIDSLWPSNVFSLSPESTFQIFTVQSSDPEIIYFPSGEKHTDFTFSVWPSKILSSCHVSEFQSYI